MEPVIANVLRFFQMGILWSGVLQLNEIRKALNKLSQ